LVLSRQRCSHARPRPTANTAATVQPHMIDSPDRRISFKVKGHSLLSLVSSVLQSILYMTQSCSYLRSSGRGIFQLPVRRSGTYQRTSSRDWNGTHGGGAHTVLAASNQPCLALKLSVDTTKTLCCDSGDDFEDQSRMRILCWTVADVAISPTPSLFVAQRPPTYSTPRGTWGYFEETRGAWGGKEWCAGAQKRQYL